MNQIVCAWMGVVVATAAAAPLSAQSFSREPGWAAALTGFGAAVAAGDAEVFIAEPFTAQRSGIVYVYRRSGADSWQAVAQLTASDGTAGDGFGRSMAVAGTTLVVGATGPDGSRGALYTFRRTGDGAWRQSSRIQPPDLSGGDEFGGAVALGGAVAAVGASGQDEGAGAVYVLRRDERGGWRQEAKLVASDAAARSGFGTALAVDGEWLLVGAPRHGDDQGAAYVFHRDAATSAWAGESALQSRLVQAGSRFGSSLLLDGDVAYVGAPGHGGFVGGVVVFRRDTATGVWADDGLLLPYDGGRGYRFGTAMAVVDQELWVGASGAEGGVVYRFRRGTDGAWTGVQKLSAAALEARDGFGGAVAARGGVAVVGVVNDDYGEGSAVIFERGPEGWTEAARVLSEPFSYPAVTGGEVKCRDGMAKTFDCGDVDLVSFLPVGAIGGGRGVRLNDIWGWTDPETGKEYVIVGRIDGAAFVDISDPAQPVYLGELPRTAGARVAVWRDMKVYQHYVFVVSDGAGEHGVQIFDLTRLRNVRHPPVTFTEDAHYDKVHSVHNIVIDEETGFAYAVGSGQGGETCGGGLHMIDIRDPLHPAFAGCFSDPSTGRRRTGYTHDAQCVVYHGPDQAHDGREICFGANETALSIADVTDKQHPVALAVAEYPNVGYTHQGWLTGDQTYFYMDDELDELQGGVTHTRTLVWDVSDLDDPVLVKEYFADNGATDHNLYVVGDYVYESNYVSGLRVLDIHDRENPKAVGFFDTVPYGDNVAGFGGSWSNYPFFKSGIVAVTSGSEGLFLLRKRDARPIP